MGSSVDVLGISDQAITVYSWFVYGALCPLIDVFGVVTNIINIICFAKQGFQESVNISLLGLALCDLGSLTTMIATCIVLTPAVLAADLSFDAMEVMYLTSVMTHFSFTRVSGCITAMITVERCLCITAPLQIKRIITPTRTTVITICMFIIFFSSCAPVYTVNRLDTKFSYLLNRTIYGLVSTEDREEVEMLTFAINNFFIPFCSFIIIVICTTILSYQLRRKSKWRQNAVIILENERVGSRNQKASKMAVMISILFIACFVPITIIMLAAAFLPDISINGKYMNVSIIIAGFGYIMESINSSMNIFIYYHMSSKYRNSFTLLLCKKMPIAYIENK